jgi:hypothetical protein
MWHAWKRQQKHTKSKAEWSRHFKDLWIIKQEEEPIINFTADENVQHITVERLNESMKYSKNKKHQAVME